MPRVEDLCQSLPYFGTSQHSFLDLHSSSFSDKVSNVTSIFSPNFCVTIGQPLSLPLSLALDAWLDPFALTVFGNHDWDGHALKVDTSHGCLRNSFFLFYIVTG